MKVSEMLGTQKLLLLLLMMMMVKSCGNSDQVT